MNGSLMKLLVLTSTSLSFGFSASPGESYAFSSKFNCLKEYELNTTGRKIQQERMFVKDYNINIALIQKKRNSWAYIKIERDNNQNSFKTVFGASRNQNLSLVHVQSFGGLNHFSYSKDLIGSFTKIRHKCSHLPFSLSTALRVKWMPPDKFSGWIYFYFELEMGSHKTYSFRKSLFFKPQKYSYNI